MKIKVYMEQDVPKNFTCKGCTRVERDHNGQTFCSLFNRYLYMRGGNFLKCRECVNALYDAIDEED